METLPELYPGSLYLLLLPRSLRREMINILTARLALRGQVRVLVAGNRFDAHAIARLLRRQTHHLTQALARIQVARSFTCYQVLSLLKETPALPTPTLVPDLLETFYDENVALSERRTLLSECLSHFHRLSRQAPVAVSALGSDDGEICNHDYPGTSPRSEESSDLPAGDELMQMLQGGAGQVLRFAVDLPQEHSLQMRLF